MLAWLAFSVSWAMIASLRASLGVPAGMRSLKANVGA